MRIMIDTNVLISAALFRNSKLAQSVIEVSEKHTVILCSQIIDELHEVFNRKFTDKLIALEIFLTELSYEMVYTPVYYEDIPQLRDSKDTPILAAAIYEDVDVLITGDKDFSNLDIDRPEILTPAEFLSKY